MNIEELVKCIEKRPCMYIEEFNFDYLFHFIRGFLYHNASNNIDRIFKYEFHEWTKKWIEKHKNILFEQERDYHYYIQNVCKTQQECFELFFKLCYIFFDELHDKVNL